MRRRNVFQPDALLRTKRIVGHGALPPKGPTMFYIAHKSRSISDVSSFSTVSQKSVLRFDPIHTRALCVGRDPAVMY